MLPETRYVILCVAAIPVSGYGWSGRKILVRSGFFRLFTRGQGIDLKHKRPAVPAFLAKIDLADISASNRKDLVTFAFWAVKHSATLYD